MLIKHNDVSVNNIENMFNKKSILFKGFYQIYILYFIYILKLFYVFAFTHLLYLSLNTLLKKKCLILSANVHSSYTS